MGRAGRSLGWVGKIYGALSRDLTTVVGNLVDNALDAAAGGAGPAPARVEVLILDHDDTVEVTVRDSVRRIPDVEQVFRQGWSTKASPRTRDVGSGWR